MFTGVTKQLKVYKMQGACTSGSFLACYDLNAKVYLFDLKTMAFAASTAGVLSLPAGNATAIAFIDTYVILAWVGSTLYHVDFSGAGSVTSMTSQSIFSAGFIKTARNQIVASQVSQKKCVGLSSSVFLTINNSGGSPITSQFTISGGKTYNCIIASTANTNNYITASVDGFIYDVTFNGIVNKSFRLPTTGTKSGSALTSFYPTALSMDPSGTFLYVGCLNGFLYKYLYSTNTLVEQILVGQPGNAIFLSEIVNNQMIVCPGGIQRQFGQPLNLNYVSQGTTLGTSPTIEIDYVMLGGGVGLFAGLGLNADSGLAWALVPGNGSAQDTDLILFYELDGLSTASGVDQTQIPLGTDVAARLIKIATPESYNGYVESDSTIIAGSQPTTYNQSNQCYVELSVTGTQGVSENVDYKRVRA